MSDLPSTDQPPVPARVFKLPFTQQQLQEFRTVVGTLLAGVDLPPVQQTQYTRLIENASGSESDEKNYKSWVRKLIVQIESQELDKIESSFTSRDPNQSKYRGVLVNDKGRADYCIGRLRTCTTTLMSNVNTDKTLRAFYVLSLIRNKLPTDATADILPPPLLVVENALNVLFSETENTRKLTLDLPRRVVKYTIYPFIYLSARLVVGIGEEVAFRVLGTDYVHTDQLPRRGMSLRLPQTSCTLINALHSMEWSQMVNAENYKIRYVHLPYPLSDALHQFADGIASWGAQRTVDMITESVFNATKFALPAALFLLATRFVVTAHVEQNTSVDIMPIADLPSEIVLVNTRSSDPSVGVLCRIPKMDIRSELQVGDPNIFPLVLEHCPQGFLPAGVREKYEKAQETLHVRILEEQAKVEAEAKSQAEAEEKARQQAAARTAEDLRLPGEVSNSDPGKSEV